MSRFEKLWAAMRRATHGTSGRTSLALGGWHIFLEHPLGVGTGGSELAWAKLGYVEGISNLKAGEEFSLHSGWIKVLAENGLPGILAFIAVVGSFAFVGWRSGDTFLRLMGFAVTWTLFVAFLSTEFQGKAFWFLAAGSVALLNRHQMLLAVAGGRHRSVWWVRPTMPTDALRPRPVGPKWTPARLCRNRFHGPGFWYDAAACCVRGRKPDARWGGEAVCLHGAGAARRGRPGGHLQSDAW